MSDMKTGTTTFPWRGIVVHLSSQSHRNVVRISDQTSIKVVDYPSSGDEGDETVFEAAFKSLYDNVHGPSVPLKPVLKKKLLNLDLVINTLNIIKRCSAVQVASLEANFLSCFGSSLQQPGCPHSIEEAITCLLQENCIEQSSHTNGELWVFRKCISETQYLKRISVQPSKVNVVPITEGLFNMIQEGWCIRGVVSTPSPATGRFYLLPLNTSSSDSVSPTTPSAKISFEVKSNSGIRGVFTVLVNGRREKASLVCLVRRGLYLMRLLASGQHVYASAKDLRIYSGTEQLSQATKALTLTAIGRVPYDGEIITATVVGTIDRGIQVAVNEEELISEFIITINQEGVTKDFDVRAVRVKESLYLAYQDLPAICLPDISAARAVQYSNLSRFYNKAPSNTDCLVKLTGQYRELVIARDSALATMKFIPAYALAKMLLAYGNQPDRLIWELLLG